MAYLNGKEVVLVGLKGDKGDPGVGALKRTEDAILNQTLVPVFESKSAFPTTMGGMIELFGLPEAIPVDGLTRAAFLFLNGTLKVYELWTGQEGKEVTWDPNDDGDVLDEGDTIALVPTSTEDSPKLYIVKMGSSDTDQELTDVVKLISGPTLFVDEEGYISIDY